MAEQHVQVLSALGLTKEQTDILENMTPEQLKEFKPDDLVGAAFTGMKTKLTNDAEFLKTIPEDKIDPSILKRYESGQYARFQNELVEVATKKLGLEDKDLTPEDRKSIKTMAEKMANLYLGKKGNVEGLQKMQGELQEARQKLDEMTTKHQEVLTAELNKLNGANSAKIIRMLTRVELSSMEGISLKVGANLVSDPVLALLNSKYAVVLGDDDSLSIAQKENPKLKVVDDKGKEVTFAQALKQAALDLKIADPITDDGKGGPGKTKKVVVGDGGGSDDNVTIIPDYIKNKMNLKDDSLEK